MDFKVKNIVGEAYQRLGKNIFGYVNRLKARHAIKYTGDEYEKLLK